MHFKEDLSPMEHLWDIMECDIPVTEVQLTNLLQLCDDTMWKFSKIQKYFPPLKPCVKIIQFRKNWGIFNTFFIFSSRSLAMDSILVNSLLQTL